MREALHSLDLGSVSDGDGFQVCNSVAVCCDESGNSSEGNQIDARQGSRVMSRSGDAECARRRMMNLEYNIVAVGG